MTRFVRLALLLCCLGSTVQSAQDPSQLPITATARADVVRFSGGAGAVQMRIHLFAPDADAPLLETPWHEGNLLDWQAAQSRLADGSYRCVVEARAIDGAIGRREGTLLVRDGVVSVELSPVPAEPHITALIHDGSTAAVVSTKGDLSFRLGNVFAATDSEAMRLTREGTLEVAGEIHAAKGIRFPDGTVLTSAGEPAASAQPKGLAPIGTSAAPSIGQRPAGKQRADFAAASQFVVGPSGVTVGMTNPDYALSVAGVISSSSGYTLAGLPLLASRRNGSGSLAFGYYAGESNQASGNSFFGTQSGQVTTTGSRNSFFGYQAGASNITGTDGAFFGNFAGVLATASFNTFIGASAGSQTSTGSRNTVVGFAALNSNTTGGYNTAVGASALSSCTGGNNIALGYSAGSDVTSGSYNIYIGNRGSAAETNTIRIGEATYHSRVFIKGISGVTTGMAAVPVLVDSLGQLGTASSSSRYKTDIQDMGHRTDALMRLRPVTFHHRTEGSDAPIQYGLIAEEVAEVYPDLVVRNENGEPESVMYQLLAPMLLNQVQQQQRTIDRLAGEIEALTNRLNALERKR